MAKLTEREETPNNANRDKRSTKYKPTHEIINGRLHCGIRGCYRDIPFFIAYFKAQEAAKNGEANLLKLN